MINTTRLDKMWEIEHVIRHSELLYLSCSCEAKEALLLNIREVPATESVCDVIVCCGHKLAVQGEMMLGFKEPEFSLTGPAAGRGAFRS